MSNRVFICSSDPFPFGTANSNYIRNFSKCLKAAGFSVFVVGIGKNRECDKIEDFYQYNGVKYFNIDISLKGKKNFINAELNAGKKVEAELEKLGVTKEDYICIYSGLLSIIKMAIKKVPISHVISIEVEWLQPFQYSLGKLDPMFRIWNMSFEYRLKKIKKFFPISKNLENHIKEKGASCCVIPVMTDSSEISIDVINPRKDGFTNMIYSGAATNKDSFPCMIEAIYKLSYEERKKIKLHFTTLSLDALKKCLGDSVRFLDDIMDSLVFHGWMEYEDLLRLYADMDCILLARESNRATISNFPSKIPELMAYAVFPICSDVGDYSELYLKDGYDSIIFNGDDSDSCCEAIRRAISLDNQSICGMRKNARNTVELRFDYLNWVETVSEFIIG